MQDLATTTVRFKPAADETLAQRFAARVVELEKRLGKVSDCDAREKAALRIVLRQLKHSFQDRCIQYELDLIDPTDVDDRPKPELVL